MITQNRNRESINTVKKAMSSDIFADMGNDEFMMCTHVSRLFYNVLQVLLTIAVHSSIWWRPTSHFLFSVDKHKNLLKPIMQLLVVWPCLLPIYFMTHKKEKCLCFFYYSVPNLDFKQKIVTGRSSQLPGPLQTCESPRRHKRSSLFPDGSHQSRKEKNE